MPYRVEESKNSRAGCKNAECKHAAIKIQKGELRFATQVTINDHTSWSYKHWGCVTPAQVANLVEDCGGDTDLVDGYDELPEGLQEKVDFALENGHVPDEDWKGDIACNRPGQKGFRLTAAQRKKAQKEAEDDDEALEAPKPKAKAKRGRAADEVENQVPAPKKARGKGKKAITKEEDDEDGAMEEDDAPKQKPKRGKKATAKKGVETDTEEPKATKAKRGRKAAPKEDLDEDDAEEPEATKTKRSKKVADETKEQTSTQKRSGRKKAPVNYEEE